MDIAVSTFLDHTIRYSRDHNLAEYPAQFIVIDYHSEHQTCQLTLLLPCVMSRAACRSWRADQIDQSPLLIL
jgi:hypothetical protein